MPICSSPNAVIFFAHIPKTGGSSVEAYLRQKGQVSLFGEPKIGGVHQQHLSRDVIAGLPDLPDFDCSFAVLRDPVSRLVSEFLWRSDPLKPLQKIARFREKEVVRRIKVDGVKRSLTFSEWVPLCFEETRKNPNHRDNHMRPQIDFLASGDRLFSFERGLEGVFQWLDEITQTSASSRGERLKASGGSKPHVSGEIRELIESYYDNDLRLCAEVAQGRRVL
ncbi:MAG: sulfotransferase family protein [Pelagimonas sp.]|jgi:hypothetical protein|nr:sulfotransferase family protein [Pelagimonas sp.]